jgi:SPP1 family phage portal protein
MFFEKTHGEELAQMIENNSNVTNEKIIKAYIDTHDNSHARIGVRYYNGENDIVNRRQYAVINDVKVEDLEKPNNKVAHGYHKILVDQKTSYMVGNPINFATDDEAFLEHINEHLGEKFDDTINELVKGASNKGREWLHPYIDEEGNFDYIAIPDEQFIPIYEGSKQKTLQYGIRYYPITVNGKDSVKVEWWDDKQVTYYIRENEGYKLDPYEETNPQSHFEYGTVKDGYKGYGWGRVPFIKFKNNEEERSDLSYYKSLIDSYDKRVSDNQNSFDEIQELITILKGYEGENLSEFMQNLKYYKAIKVSEDGGVDTLKNEIPMTSIDSHLDRLDDNIYTFGMGVNTNTDTFGNAPSGIALKFLFSLLDLKATTTERKIRPSIQELLWYLAEFLGITNKGDYDYKSVDMTFQYNVMMNELEQADIAQKSAGLISQDTLLANHPWVDDLQQEKERMEAEKEAYVDLNRVNINEPGTEV